MSDKTQILIVISAFNEETTIAKVITQLQDYGYVNILVVNDGSTDATGQIAQSKGALVAHHVVNCGLGTALATGFSLAQFLDAAVVVTCDADGQHDPADIDRLVTPILNNEADVVIGSRMILPQGMPWRRYVYNHLANITTFILFGFSTTDTQSGLRAFSKKALSSISISGSRMECSSEIIYKVKQAHLRLKEVSIKPIYTAYSLSKGQSFAGGVKTLLRLVLHALTRR